MKRWLDQILKVIKSDVDHHCCLETTANDHTFITRTGGYLSVFEIKGAFVTTGENFRNQTLDLITDKLEGILKTPGHKVSFYFIQDPAAGKDNIRESIDEMRETATRLELDFEAIIDETESVLSKSSVYKKCYMTIETLPKVLTNSQVKEAYSERQKKAKRLGSGIKQGDYGQSPCVQLGSILNLHDAFVSSFVNGLGEYVIVEDLTTHQALLVCDKQISGGNIKNKEFYLPGDRIPLRNLQSYNEHDVSDLLYPLISHQLFDKEPALSPTDRTVCEIGNKYESSVYLELQQKNPTHFSILESSLPKDMPYRACLTIETGTEQVMKRVSSKHTVASILFLAGSTNKEIVRGTKELMDYVESGHILVNTQLVITTWADSEDTVKRNRDQLSVALKGWGSTSVTIEQGDPIRASLDTIVGFTSEKTGPQIPMLLDDSLDMLPVFFTSSPWKKGTTLFRLLDSNIYPYAEGTSLQSAFNSITFAKPGSGKSVLLAIKNSFLLLTPGLKQLPKITCIDIGPSSKHWAQFVQNSLPESKKDLVVHYKVEMTPDYATNPFDTPLGCTRPLSVDRSFLVNFLTVVLTPAGVTKPISRLSEFVSLMVDEMYDYFSPDKNPNPYEAGVNPEVDRVLQELDIEIEEDASWWDVQEKLFDLGRYKESTIAQRYCMPVLNDATTVISNSNNIKDSYRSARIDGEPLIDFVVSMLTTAVKDYPIISQPTVFDIANARIVSIDLSSVAQKGSAAANKQTCITYMLARFFGCKGFYFGKENLSEIPDKYYDYHSEIIKSEEGIPKKVCMDEYHRTEFGDPESNPVRLQTVTDKREGRKFFVMVDVLSQFERDFTEDMMDAANSIFIMSKSLSHEATEKLIKKFNFSSDTKKDYINYVSGPGKDGSSMVLIADINNHNSRDKNKSRAETVLNLLVGPTQLWATSNTKQDISLRDRMTEKTGSISKALQILAKEFPSGGAKQYIESYRQKDPNTDLYDELTSQLMEKYKGLL